MERECSDFACLLWFLLFDNCRKARLSFFVFPFFVSGSFSCAMDGSADNGTVSLVAIGNSSVAAASERVVRWRDVTCSFPSLRSKTENSSSGDTGSKRECAVWVPECDPNDLLWE